MARVVVLGGTGYAGRHIVAEAVSRGHDVVAVARKAPADPVDPYPAPPAPKPKKKRAPLGKYCQWEERGTECMPEVLTTPTGWLLPGAMLYSRTGLDTGGGVSSDSRVGLGEVAEFGIATTDAVRAGLEIEGGTVTGWDSIKWETGSPAKARRISTWR